MLQQPKQQSNKRMAASIAQLVRCTLFWYGRRQAELRLCAEDAFGFQIPPRGFTYNTSRYVEVNSIYVLRLAQSKLKSKLLFQSAFLSL